MTHKNLDNIRSNRFYAYMTEAEKDQFFKAMQLKDMSQQSTALRQFALAHAEQIIITSRQPNQQSNQKPAPLPAVMLRLLDGANTVLHTVISTVKQ